VGTPVRPGSAIGDVGLIVQDRGVVIGVTEGWAGVLFPPCGCADQGCSPLPGFHGHGVPA